MVKIIWGTKSGSFFNKGWRIEKLDRAKQRGEYFHAEKLSRSYFRKKKKKKEVDLLVSFIVVTPALIPL